MSEWKEVKLGDVAEIMPDFAFSSQNFIENNRHAKVIKITDISPPFIDISNAMFVDLKPYDKKDGLCVEVRLEDETVWLSQKQMGELFDKDVRTINEHIQNICKGEGLETFSTIWKFRIVQQEEKRKVESEIAFYNLDVIISVGYRVKSLRDTDFYKGRGVC